MSPYLAEAILIGFIAWSVGIGYEARQLGVDSQKSITLAAVEAEKTAHHAAQAEADAKATKYESDLAVARKQADTLEKQVEDSYAKVVDNCAVPADFIVLRNNAAR